jgi:hypothetical protein
VDHDLEPDDREAKGAVDGAGDDRGHRAVLRTPAGGEAPAPSCSTAASIASSAPVSRE